MKLRKNEAKTGRDYGQPSSFPVRRQYPRAARTVSLRFDKAAVLRLSALLATMGSDEEINGDIVLTGHGNRLTVMGQLFYSVGPPRQS